MSTATQILAGLTGLVSVVVFIVLAFHGFDRWVDRKLEDEHRRNGTKPRKSRKG